MELTERQKKAIEEIKRMKEHPLTYEQVKAQTEAHLAWARKQKRKRLEEETQKKVQ